MLFDTATTTGPHGAPCKFEPFSTSLLPDVHFGPTTVPMATAPSHHQLHPNHPGPLFPLGHPELTFDSDLDDTASSPGTPPFDDPLLLSEEVGHAGSPLSFVGCEVGQLAWGGPLSPASSVSSTTSPGLSPPGFGPAGSFLLPAPPQHHPEQHGEVLDELDRIGMELGPELRQVLTFAQWIETPRPQHRQHFQQPQPRCRPRPYLARDPTAHAAAVSIPTASYFHPHNHAQQQQQHPQPPSSVTAVPVPRQRRARSKARQPSRAKATPAAPSHTSPGTTTTKTTAKRTAPAAPSTTSTPKPPEFLDTLQGLLDSGHPCLREYRDDDGEGFYIADSIQLAKLWCGHRGLKPKRQKDGNVIYSLMGYYCRRGKLKCFKVKFGHRFKNVYRITA